jgi:hypothetical protein
MFWEKYSKWSKNQVPPVFNRRRCAAQWKKMGYSNQKLKDRLGWKPNVPMEDAMKEFLAQFGPDDDAKSRSHGSGSQTSEAGSTAVTI